MNQLNKVTTAKKGAMSAGVATGAGGVGFGVVLVAKYVFHRDISLEEGMMIQLGVTAGISGIGRAIENVVKWYVNLKNDVALSEKREVK